MSFRARFSNTSPSSPYGQALGTATNYGYERMIIIVGDEDSPSGLRKVETSRPHIAHLSRRWAEAIMHKTVRRHVGIVHVIFPDDDANAMCLLLAIAHTDTVNLPVRLSLDEIIHLAQVAERYDLNHLLVGYLEPWLAPHRQRITERGYEHWLYVAWQFGIEKDYLFLADYLAVNCAINEQRKLLIPSTDRLFTGHFPRNTLRAIYMNRIQIIWGLLSIAYSMIHEMLHTRSCRLPQTPHWEQDLCTARSSYGLQRYLEQHGLMPQLRTANMIFLSAQQIRKVLTDPEIATYVRGGGATSISDSSTSGSAERQTFHRHNVECRIEDELERRIRNVLKSAPCGIEAPIIDQLRWNADRMGEHWKNQIAAARPAQGEVNVRIEEE